MDKIDKNSTYSEQNNFLICSDRHSGYGTFSGENSLSGAVNNYPSQRGVAKVELVDQQTTSVGKKILQACEDGWNRFQHAVERKVAFRQYQHIGHMATAKESQKNTAHLESVKLYARNHNSENYSNTD